LGSIIFNVFILYRVSYRIWYWFLNCVRDGLLNRDFDRIWDWFFNFVRDRLSYWHWVWLRDSYRIRSINGYLHWDRHGFLHRVRHWFRNWYGNLFDNCHWVRLGYRHRIGTVNRYVHWIRDWLSYRVRDRLFYWHWVWLGNVNCVWTINRYLHFNRIRPVNWDSDWDFDVNRVGLRYWDLHVDWIWLWDWHCLLDNNWIRLGYMHWVGLWYRNFDFLGDWDWFLYRDNHRIWSIYRDLNWNWDILNDRVWYGFINRDRYRHRPVNWDIYRIRHWLLNRDRYHFLYWNFNWVWLRYCVSDLLGVYVRFHEEAMSITVTSNSWQQSVTEAASSQGSKLSKSADTIAVTQVKQPSLILDGFPRSWHGQQH
jgi:hypothetical protein